MDTFKTEPGSSEEILITEENFSQKTKKRFPYYTAKYGKTLCKAVCPMCDNPIQIIGLYKREEDSKKKPYGRHTKSDLYGIAIYNEEDYLNCPYHNPNRNINKTKRKPGDKKSLFFYQTMKNHFDLIIHILEKSLHMLISDYLAETLLIDWKNNEGWRYYDTYYHNLPYMLLFAEPSYTLYGKLIRKDSKFAKTLIQNGQNIAVQNTNMRFYDKIVQKDGFLDASFYLTEHKYVRNGEHTEEYCYFVVNEQKKEIYREKIVIDHEELYKLIQNQDKRNSREERLIQIASKIL